MPPRNSIVASKWLRTADMEQFLSENGDKEVPNPNPEGTKKTVKLKSLPGMAVNTPEAGVALEKAYEAWKGQDEKSKPKVKKLRPEAPEVEGLAKTTTEFVLQHAEGAPQELIQNVAEGLTPDPELIAEAERLTAEALKDPETPKDKKVELTNFQKWIRDFAGVETEKKEKTEGAPFRVPKIKDFPESTRKIVKKHDLSDKHLKAIHDLTKNYDELKQGLDLDVRKAKKSLGDEEAAKAVHNFAIKMRKDKDIDEGLSKGLSSFSRLEDMLPKDRKEYQKRLRHKLKATDPELAESVANISDEELAVLCQPKKFTPQTVAQDYLIKAPVKSMNPAEVAEVMEFFSNREEDDEDEGEEDVGQKKKPLRASLIRLAYTKTSLRSHVLPLLRG